MSKIILYGHNISPPVRSCLLTLKALVLPFEYVHVELFAGEHMTKEYLEKNPQHTVPTLEDNGHFIWDSHAIIQYLVSKYGKDDSFYPKDLLKRAVVDQRLHFDSGVVYNGLANITVPIWLKNEIQIPQHKIDNIHRIYDFMEIFLKDTPYVAGDHLTIADFSIAPSLTSLPIFTEIDSTKYPKTTEWIKRMQELPYYQEANEVGGQKYAEMLRARNFTIVS